MFRVPALRFKFPPFSKNKAVASEAPTVIFPVLVTVDGPAAFLLE